MTAWRHGRRVEEHERRGSEPGGGKCGRRHRAPAVTDDLEIGAIQAGRADERGHVGGVVAEPVVALPMSRPAVPRLVDGDDPPARRRERRPEPPPHGRGRRHAVDQQQWPRPRIAPGQRRPRDPGRLDRDALARGRRLERGRDGGGQVRLDHVPDRSTSRRIESRPRHLDPRRTVTAMANQFVVQLKNEPGAMASLAEALAARGVDLRAIGGGSIGDSGHVIMTTADDETTKAVLDERGYVYIEGESLVTEVDDKPGGMARLSRALADAGVNIYGHLFLGRWGDRAMFAFVVDKPDIARPILERKG